MSEEKDFLQELADKMHEPMLAALMPPIEFLLEEGAKKERKRILDIVHDVLLNWVGVEQETYIYHAIVRKLAEE